MRKIYIAHPLRGADREKNVEEVTKICKKVVELFPDVLPVSPIHAFSFLDNCGAEGEKKALDLCLETLKNCDEAWFFGNWEKSEGCSAEFDAAHVRRVYGPQDCKQILTLSVCRPDEGNRSNLARWLLEGDSSELARWLLAEVYVPELKPCPFCGSEAVLNSEYGFIACGNDSCYMTCSINWGNRAMDRVKTRAEAIAAWNRRSKHDKF